MSGYFSQLARSTGLSIDRSHTGSMPGPPVASVAAPSRDTGLEVEEVVLVAPQQTDSSSESQPSDRSASSVQSDEEANPLHVSENLAARNVADDAIDATGSARTKSRPEPAVDHKSPQDSLSEQSKADAIQTFVVEPGIEASEPQKQLLPEAREPSISIQPIERIELVTRDVTADKAFTSESNIHEPELNNAVTQPRNPGANARSDSPALPTERTRFDQPQLKEVIAWVTANPTNIEEEPFPEIFIPSRNEPGNEFADHSQLDSLAPRPARAQAPQIQDFSLSIGNISIVIDEPKQDAPALPTPPPIIERPPEVSDRPTDLSRYYLDRW